MAEFPSKQKWDAENTRTYTVKLFRKTDQELIDYLENKSKGDTLRKALREYMKYHPDIEIDEGEEL